MKSSPVGSVTLVMAYYDNAEMLLRHLEEWAAYPQEARERVSLVLVDDGSPNRDAASVLHQWAGGRDLAEHLPLRTQVFRIVPNIPWNQDGARNLGMRHAVTEWCFMTDMDHVLPRGEVSKLLGMDSLPRIYYLPNQLLVEGTSLERPHPNSYLMRTLDFWSMGGYDEDFAGWYGSDGNFRRCAKGAGLREQPTRAFSTVVYRTHDIADANTKDLGRKGSSFHAVNNPVLAAKRSGPPYRAVNPIRFPWVRVL